jgi:hypothetical protein
MAVKLTRMTHKIAIQLHLVVKSFTTWSSRSRWPVRKLLDTLVLCFKAYGICHTSSHTHLHDHWSSEVMNHGGETKCGRDLTDQTVHRRTCVIITRQWQLRIFLLIFYSHAYTLWIYTPSWIQNIRAWSRHFLLSISGGAAHLTRSQWLEQQSLLGCNMRTDISQECDFAVRICEKDCRCRNWSRVLLKQ